MKYLHEVLDRENYERLVQEFGGMRIWVPKPGNLGHRAEAYYAGRDREIIELREDGVSIRLLAQMYDLSEKRIYGILNACGERSRRRRRREGDGRRRLRTASTGTALASL